MSNIRKMVLANMVAVTVASIAHAATQKDIVVHATVCHGTDSTAAAALVYDQYGLHNTSSASVAVECPLSIEHDEVTTETIVHVFVTGYDRSTSDNVSCQLRKVTSDGTNIGTPITLQSSGSNAAAFTPLDFVPSSSFGNVFNGFFSLRCTIPGVQAGLFSHLTTMTIQTVR